MSANKKILYSILLLTVKTFLGEYQTTLYEEIKTVRTHALERIKTLKQEIEQLEIDAKKNEDLAKEVAEEFSSILKILGFK
jgi:hypothetical protein